MAPRDSSDKIRILFITRKYPPSVGGMERLSYELITNIKNRVKCTVIAWGYSQAFLPIFLPIALFRSILSLFTKRIELIHIGDALLSPLGYFLKKTTRKPVAVNLHGLDLTFPNRFYQWMIRNTSLEFDLYICNSCHTRSIAVAKGIPEEKLCVIPCGVQIMEKVRKTNRRENGEKYLEQILGETIEGKRIILTVGRLVKRKGVQFFVREVMPSLVMKIPSLLYIIVGEGEEENPIRREIQAKNLDNHVVMPGRVGGEELEMLYAASDLFIMPNIPVEGDAEGFGIVAIEASLAGLPVVASGIEGIKDAVTQGENGILLEAGDDRAFVDTIAGLLTNDLQREALVKRGREFTKRQFSWEYIVKDYHQAFESCLESFQRNNRIRQEV